jgi:hypothetical protein
MITSRSPTSPTSWNDEDSQHQQRPTSPGSSILANVKPKTGSFIEGDGYNNNNNSSNNSNSSNSTTISLECYNSTCK